ncbi:hypothetical protein [Streptomyces tubercidicus]|uniref:hypothetical protein n=1 Tax=Streptomyces tubercidicus TaxID=47759 RepID=UPI0036C78156
MDLGGLVNNGGGPVPLIIDRAQPQLVEARLFPFWGCLRVLRSEDLYEGVSDLP